MCDVKALNHWLHRINNMPEFFVFSTLQQQLTICIIIIKKIHEYHIIFDPKIHLFHTLISMLHITTEMIVQCLHTIHAHAVHTLNMLPMELMNILQQFLNTVNHSLFDTAQHQILINRYHVTMVIGIFWNRTHIGICFSQALLGISESATLQIQTPTIYVQNRFYQRNIIFFTVIQTTQIIIKCNWCISPIYSHDSKHIKSSCHQLPLFCFFQIV